MTEEVKENKEDKSFIEKTAEFISEEVKDFKKAGSIGGYVAEKATDLVVDGAEKLGAEKLANAIDNNREIIVGTLGTVINAKVGAGLTKLATSNENGELGDRVGDGLAAVAVKSAQKLGAEGVAQTLDTNREVISNKTSNIVNKYTDVAIAELKETLLGQQGSEPVNPTALKQSLQIQKRIDNRALESKNNTIDKKTVKTTIMPQALISQYERA